MIGEGADLEALAAAAAGMESGDAAGSGLQPDASPTLQEKCPRPPRRLIQAPMLVWSLPPPRNGAKAMWRNWMEADLTGMRVKLSKQMSIDSAMGRASLSAPQRASLEKTKGDVQRLSALIEAKQQEIKEARRVEEAKAKAVETK